MDGFNVSVLLTIILIFQLVSARPGETPPKPTRNNFDDDEILKQENKKVEGRKGEEARDIFDVIMEVNENFANSKVARAGKINLYQGDIIENEVTDEIKKEEVGPKRRKKRAAMRSTRRLWTKRGSFHVVPYVITSSNNHARSKILGAMGEWMTKVPCLKFVRRTNEGSYLSFFSGGGCYSMVGMQGGKQAISIGRGCEHHGVIVHEIGHALGFWHEQSRPDRDGYIRINRGNIMRGMEHNFNKYTTTQINSYGQSYDFGSVMHYGAYAFSSNRRPTITKLNGGTTGLGQRNGLSAGDVTQARMMYCGGTGPGPTQAPTGCTEDKNQYCGAWAKKGFCTNEKYRKFMTENCCRSCKAPEPTTVPPPCVNKHGDDKCNRWARDGLCKIGQCFMLTECCRSCKYPPAPTTAAPECVDKETACGEWKSAGYCDDGSSYYDYVSKNCRKSCGIC
uniref:Metalloendopeptidase n=1 Tax=Ceriantheomorphe brasiliensis TaxID=1048506 RepID=A0A7G7WYR8_9CNID|nr:toxin candidate TRINITY_DN8389_c0_g2_i1 [Ceriantheomorphe brasiliensis]